MEGAGLSGEGGGEALFFLHFFVFAPIFALSMLQTRGKPYGNACYAG